MKNPFLEMALSVALARAFMSPAMRRANRQEKSEKRKGHSSGWAASGYGEQECARRRRQIAKGMIQISKGV